MASVTVPLEIAESRRLPAVCAMTGAAASGYVPVAVRASRFRRTTILVPLSARAFARWERTEHMRMRSPIAAIGFGLAGALLLLKGGVYAAPLFIAAIAAFGAYWYATMRSPWRLPTAVPRGKGRIELIGVHDEFVAAVQGGRV